MKLDSRERERAACRVCASACDGRDSGASRARMTGGACSCGCPSSLQVGADALGKGGMRRCCARDGSAACGRVRGGASAMVVLRGQAAWFRRVSPSQFLTLAAVTCLPRRLGNNQPRQHRPFVASCCSAAFRQSWHRCRVPQHRACLTIDIKIATNNGSHPHRIPRARLRGSLRLCRNVRGRLEPRQQWLLRSHEQVPSVPEHSGCDLVSQPHRRGYHVHVQWLRWGDCHN